MLQVTAQMRIVVAVAPADFRKGIDGLAGLCRHLLGKDPFSGFVFVFRNRRATAVKLLCYDGQGFWLCQKRMSRGRFRWWPENPSAISSAVEAHQLAVLLSGGDPSAATGAPAWRPVGPGE